MSTCLASRIEALEQNTHQSKKVLARQPRATGDYHDGDKRIDWKRPEPTCVGSDSIDDRAEGRIVAQLEQELAAG